MFHNLDEKIFLEDYNKIENILEKCKSSENIGYYVNKNTSLNSLNRATKNLKMINFKPVMAVGNKKIKIKTRIDE